LAVTEESATDLDFHLEDKGPRIIPGPGKEKEKRLLTRKKQLNK
jgi:hypothetical protein